MSSMDNGDPQCAQAAPVVRFTGAPQLEQLTDCMLRRSASICAADIGRMKSFSRRKLKNEIKRPWRFGQRRYSNLVCRCWSLVSINRRPHVGHFDASDSLTGAAPDGLTPCLIPGPANDAKQLEHGGRRQLQARYPSNQNT